MTLTIDELEERAASFDDLVAHPAWVYFTHEAERHFGNAATVERLRVATGSAATRSVESLALATAERLAEQTAVRQVLAIPQQLATAARAAAKRARAEADPRPARGLGPNVELTRG
jgi:hypothetical protein